MKSTPTPRGNLLAVLLCSWLAVSAAGTRAQQQAPVNTAISGVVTDATSWKPVAGARVSLRRTDPGGTSSRMVTDARGRFVFGNLPKGT